MEKPTNPYVIITIIAIFLVAIFGIFADTINNKDLPDINLIQGEKGIEEINNELSVEGSAVVYANPDLAILDFGVETYNENLKDAQTANTERMEKVKNALRELGVEEKNMQTSNYYVETHYNNEYPNKWWQRGVPEVEYYTVRNGLTVRMENLTIIEKALNQSVDAGATSIGSIQFTLKDFENSREDAYKRAADMTIKRAEYIAKSMNVQLGDVLSITPSHQEINDYYWTPRLATANQMVSYDNAGGSSGASISSGQVEVKVTINARYKIEQ